MLSLRVLSLQSWTLIAIVAVASTSAGCGRIEYSQRARDAALHAPDAGASHLDGGTQFDASAVDASESADAGTGVDAGGAVDAGELVDPPCRRNADCSLGGGYCRFDTGTCGGTGTCAPTGVACPPEPMPGTEVCGCDGMTYAHWCFAARNGVSLRSSGTCP